MREPLPFIQHLRLLAALFVLYGHTLHEATTRFTDDGYLFDPPVLLEWGMGVEIFFVISGFIMAFTCEGRFGDRRFAAGFFRRRLERVAPLYWIFTTLMLGVILGMPEAVGHTARTPAYVASSYLFLPWPRADAELRPLLALGWTLNYEMFFYAVFGACLLLPRRWGAAVLAACLLTAVALHGFIPESWWILRFWTEPIVLEFLVGVGLAKLYQKGVRLPRALSVAGAAAALALVAYCVQVDLENSLLRAGLPAAVLAAAWILAADAPTGRFSRLLCLGGDASYALYLSHPFALNLVAMGWEMHELEAPWVFVIVSCTLALALATAVHLALERPLAAWLRSRTPPATWNADWWRARLRPRLRTPDLAPSARGDRWWMAGRRRRRR
ncbi:MAG TPA: acyltransferase [Opitutaceae bacterium]